MQQPQVVVQQFSMEALHLTMHNNNNQVLGMYDEMSVMYGQLDAYKHSGSRLDRSTLLDLYNGGSWSRNFKNRENVLSKMHRTAFNMTGFIQPSFVVDMVERNDPDAFNDRQFFVCPKEVEYKYGDLVVPMDPSAPKLENIFRVVRKHHSSQLLEYTFDVQGQQAFINFHDELCIRKVSIPDDEDRRGIISKAKGQCARLAMILCCLEQAVSVCHGMDTEEEEEELGWDTTVSESHVLKAKNLIDYIIEQKFSLMKAEVIIPDRDTVRDSILDTGNAKYLEKFLKFKGSQIQASDVSQYRLMPGLPCTSGSRNRYPVDQAKAFMRQVSEAGFGTCEEITKAGSKRKAFVFRKRSFSELDESRVEILKKIHIDSTTYSAAMDDENGIDSVSDGSMDNSSSSNFCTPFTGSP